MNLQVIGPIVFAYLLGAIPFGVIVSRLVTGSDVRKQGSGNIGATNVARLMGKKWGVFVLLLDALKGFAVTKFILNASTMCAGPGFTNCPDTIGLANVVAMFAVIGHCYPVYLKFKGGKGVATALGVILALAPPIVGLGFVVFAVVLGVSRRISPASLAAALAVPILSYFLKTNLAPLTAWVIAGIVWLKHKQNIVRIIQGQEPRFF